MKIRLFLILCLSLAPVTAWAASPVVEERDDDGDGYKESKVTTQGNEIIKVQVDSNKDKKYDRTFYFKNGVPSSAERDGDLNGKIDTWIQYDAKGETVVVATDKRVDGKPDYWRFLKNGSIHKREFDRNFDGKSDLRIIENNGRLVEKDYDDNFDGKFERNEKAPHGSQP